MAKVNKERLLKINARIDVAMKDTNPQFVLGLFAGFVSKTDPDLAEIAAAFVERFTRHEVP